MRNYEYKRQLTTKPSHIPTCDLTSVGWNVPRLMNPSTRTAHAEMDSAIVSTHAYVEILLWMKPILMMMLYSSRYQKIFWYSIYLQKMEKKMNLSFLQLYYMSFAVRAFCSTHFAFVYYLVARNALFIISARVF